MRIASLAAALAAVLTVCPICAQANRPENLARTATAVASSAAGDKYAAAKVVDGDANTHWASAGAQLPQELTLTWPQPVRFDTVVINPFAREDRNLYAQAKSVEVEAGGQAVTVDAAAEEGDLWIVRLPQAVEADRLAVRFVSVVESRHYVGVDEVEVYLDPNAIIHHPPAVPRPKDRAAVEVLGGRAHPCVFVTPEDVARAKRNLDTEWGKRVRDSIVSEADRWLRHDEAYWRALLPEPGACYAYGFVACPICSASWGSWAGARATWEDPGHVTCANGHRLPDAEHPDDGTGYKGPDGRIHYMVGSWNAWATEQWTMRAVPNLAHAWTLTGDDRYAERAAFFLDLVASIYAESTSGSWDYPSSPPSGRFARPWYQVARVLTPLVEAYDLIYEHPAFAQPSLRLAIEAAFPDGPTDQQRAVGTPDVKGKSWAGMTRQDNVDANLIQDGAYYCYEHSFGGMLHNGHADYMRGSLAAGALLNIPEYVTIAVDGPYSIWAQVANNADRDGHYYETSVGYALHARELYLTYVDPLRNWRSEKYPNGVDLMADAQFRSFYLLPDLSLYTAGRAPNFGDSGPDDGYLPAPLRPMSATDYGFAEAVFAGTEGAAREEFAAILRWMAGGNVETLRNARAGRDELYRADPVPDGPAILPPDAQRRVQGSWFLGQKGLALLRDGLENDAQAAFLRFGPSLNHGDLDDLGLIYYAKGWQMTYEVGYGLGSTHTQVGWGSQTASHTIVTVNEQSQRGGPEGGSGGSLYLFARLPGLKLVEADAPLAYQGQGVTQYRRTVALVGEGHDQVLVDLFRVRGGSQHDYLVGAHSQDWQVEGVQLGAEEAGSLAGPDINWADKQGVDADMIGFPNKPYWNPPPGTGYGFLAAPRRAEAAGPWSITWALGGANDARFQVSMLPESPSEAIVARGPGLYPRNRKGAWALMRRRGDNLASTFASVMAPYAKPVQAGMLLPSQLHDRVAESDREYRLGSGYGPGYLFFRGQQAGEGLTFRVPVERAGEHLLSVDFLHYPSYGTVQVSLDGRPVGDPVALTAPQARPQQRVELGRVRLEPGEHLVRVATTANSQGVMFGVQGLMLVPANKAAPPEAAPVVTLAERLPVEGTGALSAAAVHFRRAGRDEYLLSAGSDGVHRVVTPHGPMSWSGSVAYAAFEGGRLVALATAGASRVEAGGTVLEAPAAYTGQVRAVDDRARTVDVTGTLPAAGVDGEPLVLSRPEFSRTTAYRIERVEPIEGGTRVHLGTQTTLLGRGRVFDIATANDLVSDIPHEYTRSVIGGTSTRFFDGKRLVTNRGTETRIRGINFGQPMPISVDDTSVLRPGDVIAYYDIGPGDTYTVPTSVWAERGDAGWTVRATAVVKMTEAGQTRTFEAAGLEQE